MIMKNLPIFPYKIAKYCKISRKGLCRIRPSYPKWVHAYLPAHTHIKSKKKT